jgi:hypothetical protein
MGLPKWCAGAALVLAFLVGCVAPHDREIVRPPVTPDAPLPALVYDSYFTPRGTEVEAPGYIAERRDLFLLALEQIDEANFHLDFPGWVIKITQPDGAEGTNSALRRMTIRWRSDGHQPADVMLPSLKRLMDESFGQ